MHSRLFNKIENDMSKIVCSNLHMKVVLTPMLLSHCFVTSFSIYTSALVRSSIWPVNKGERNRDQVCQSICLLGHHQMEVDVCYTDIPLKGGPKR
jgi:hypothetical protein